MKSHLRMGLLGAVAATLLAVSGTWLAFAADTKPGAPKAAQATKKPADTKKPAPTTKKPADTTKKPADTTKKPADTTKKPAETKKPATGDKAENPLTKSTALGFIPADVAYYGSLLRTGEQFKDLVNSRAVAKLQEIPAVAGLLAQAQGLMAIGMLQAGPVLADADNQEAVDLLGDMFSNELFACGDDGVLELLGLMQEVRTASQIEQMKKALHQIPGNKGDDDDEEDSEQVKQVRSLLRGLNERRDTLRLPNTIIGFGLTDSKPAINQLKRLQGALEQAAAVVPELEGRVKRTKIGGDDFLVLKLDGSLIPWDQVQISEYEEEDDEFKPLVEKLRTLTLDVAFGVHGNYLLLFLGEDSKYLEKLAAKSRLVDTPEFSVLNKFADKKLVDISYSSAAYNGKAGKQSVAALDSFVEVINEAVGESGLDEETQKKLADDIKSLQASAKAGDAGAKLSFNFRTDAGYEGYAYDWNSNDVLDGSKPLTMLDHVGGDPIGFLVARAKHDPKNYDQFSKVIAKLYAYADTYAMEKIEDESAKEQYTKVRDGLLPLIKRLDTANRESLVPGFKDGQSAIVLDARSKSKQWFEQMPESEEELPMAEIAIVLGVSDAKLVAKGFQEYFDVAQAIVDKLHEIDPDKVPEIKLPEPETAKAGGGTLYFYPLPEDLKIDEKITPNAGLSDQILVLSTSRAMSERILASKPLAIKKGPLAKRTAPLAGASLFNWSGLVDALEPWINYGIEQQMDDADDDQIKGIEDQVETGLQILRCFRGCVSTKYFEDKAVVTHRESTWQDLDK